MLCFTLVGANGACGMLAARSMRPLLTSLGAEAGGLEGIDALAAEVDVDESTKGCERSAGRLVTGDGRSLTSPSSLMAIDWMRGRGLAPGSTVSPPAVLLVDGVGVEGQCWDWDCRGATKVSGCVCACGFNSAALGRSFGAGVLASADFSPSY